MSDAHWERWLGMILILAIVLCELVKEPAAIAGAVPGEVEPQATDTPAETPEPTPVVTPEPVTTAAFVLVNPTARYKKGGQKGIRYQKVKGKKVYQITSYTTDTVSLSMSHAASYRVYGGGSRKELKKKYVTVSVRGHVKCNVKYRGQEIYTVIEAKSRLTGELQYIYIRFRKKISCDSGKRLSLYENKKGKVAAKKEGTAYLTVKVRGSEKNQIRIRIVVKEEPWLVNDKDTRYDYQDMTADLRGLVRKYPGRASLSSLGTSYDKREIWCLRIGNAYAQKKLVIDAAIHGREWKNTQVIMRLSG